MKFSKLVEDSKRDPEILDIRNALAITHNLLKEKIYQIDKNKEEISSKDINTLDRLCKSQGELVDRYFKVAKNKLEIFTMLEVERLMKYISYVVLKYVEEDRRDDCADEIDSVPIDHILTEGEKSGKK